MAGMRQIENSAEDRKKTKSVFLQVPSDSFSYIIRDIVFFNLEANPLREHGRGDNRKSGFVHIHLAAVNESCKSALRIFQLE